MPEIGLPPLPPDHLAWGWYAGFDARALRPERQPLPQVGTAQVLVRNRVVGLNPVDWKVLGRMGASWGPGHVPGVDGAGEVMRLGPDVPSNWLGSRVAYHQDLRRGGSFAEYTVVDARALMRIPHAMSFADAAAFPCPALTAWIALQKLPAPAGRRLLISGAGGSVGHYLMQLACRQGWQVTAMAHARHWPRLHALGAINCLDGPLSPTHGALTNDLHVTAIIDCIGAQHAALLASALDANGHLVCIQGRIEHWPCAPFGRALSLHEVALGALHVHGSDADWNTLTGAGQQMLQDLARRDLQAEQHLLHDFDQLPTALEGLKQRNFTGKSLVHVSS
ncbi:alcohol dehydrogenase [Herbaspirillum huttiense F1]|uniref:Alcohol dehydrogenase n=1 Tax=Herbaspirillum huttiense subsp. lycopersici TaxID=3074428 RepID=A0ABU2EJ08_9BURK|nr:MULTISPECIES: alcohol dehydrogenase [Herbaspirillum]MBP1313425.1 NADPH:quinone reductase-like Zn-dependent oxidoreductase [Herbaspirillum sp. 1130]MDR9847827.1 alcohol dehydrogenase [Herbaspirillum huttiense SE1]MDT0355287.1 alcohol dehydrogenase [Herbaspirillum huttiense F1]